MTSGSFASLVFQSPALLRFSKANMSTPMADLPLDDKSDAIKLSYPFVAFFSTVFVVLRIWNDIRIKKQGYANVSDWLLALAQVSNNMWALWLMYMNLQ